MKNNSVHHSNLLKPPIKCHICEYLSRNGKEKDTPLEGFEPQSKVKIQVRCDLRTLTTRLPTIHALKMDICLICRSLM